MSNYIIFCVLIITTFLIISFPIILDIINMKITHGIMDTQGLTRRSITLSLVFIYISIQIYSIVFNKSNMISEEFRIILVSVVSYYFGKSTALDDPNKKS
jgi:hypothetical protein